MTIAASRASTPNVADGDSYPRDPYLAQIGAISAVIGAGAFMAITSLKLPLICPLRLITGVPCPLCGMTTATTALLRGDISAAGEANPLAFLFVPGMFALLLDRFRRFVKRLPESKPSKAMRRGAVVAASLLLLASWTFELFRFRTFG